MGLRDKLNIKQSTKTTSSKGSTIEHRLNQLAISSFYKAIKESELKQYLQTLDSCDVFQQVEIKDKDGKVIRKETKVNTVSGLCVVIPNGKVTLQHGKNIETLDTSFKVGEMQTYIKGIKNQVCEFIKVVK